MRRFEESTTIRGWLVLTAGLVLWHLTPVGVGAVDADDLDVTHLLGVDDAVTIELTMEIDSTTGVRERGVEVYMKNDRRSRRVFAQIVDPPFLNRTRFLAVDRGRNRSNRYLATSQGVRRLAESNRDERIFGSDFTASDLSFFETEEMVIHEIAASDASVQRFEMRPAGGGPVRTLTIDRASGLVTGVVYSENGRETRRYAVEEIGTAGGRPFPRVATMTTEAGGTQTRITIERFDTVSSIPERYFNPAALE